jgi:hypothetical protein
LSSTDDDTLAPAELFAIRTLLAFQGTVGVGPEAPTRENVARLMDAISFLSQAYPGFVEARFKGWVDQLFNAFVATPTGYAGHNFPVLYVAHHYLAWPKEPGYFQLNPRDPTITFTPFAGFTIGIPAQNTDPNDFDQAFPDNWPKYKYPDAWNTALDVLRNQCGGFDYNRQWTGEFGHAVLQTDGSYFMMPFDKDALVQFHPPPDVFLDSWDNLDGINRFQTTVMNNWSDYGRVFDKIGPVWTSQQAAVADMLKPEFLTALQYFDLLHLLIATASGTAAMRRFVHDIVNYPIEDSPEYRKDIFINHLL